MTSLLTSFRHLATSGQIRANESLVPESDLDELLLPCLSHKRTYDDILTGPVFLNNSSGNDAVVNYCGNNLLDTGSFLAFESVYLPSLLSVVLMCAIVFIASVVQASLGMGYGLTAAPLLALVDPVFVPVPTILIGMITSTMGAWSERSNINWPEVRSAVAGRLLGASAAGLLLSVIVNTSAFMIVFGLGVGLAVLLSAFNRSFAKTPLMLALMGAISGLMGTITGVGAPPLALLYQGSYAGDARPTLAAIFAVGCFLSVVVLAVIGWLGISELFICALMILPMVAGTYTGRRTRGLIDSRYRAALLSIAGVAAVILIVRGYFAW